MEKLPGNYIAGFVDGEGCFVLNFRRDVRHKRKGKPVYFYWHIEFVIHMDRSDENILKSIKNTLDCGSITYSKKGKAARYAVQNVDDLKNKIVPFFNKYKLRAKKKNDFELWKEALDIMIKNSQKKEKDNTKGFSKIEWTKKDKKRISEIVKEMKDFKGKSKQWKWLKHWYSK